MIPQVKKLISGNLQTFLNTLETSALPEPLNNRSLMIGHKTGFLINFQKPMPAFKETGFFGKGDHQIEYFLPVFMVLPVRIQRKIQKTPGVFVV